MKRIGYFGEAYVSIGDPYTTKKTGAIILFFSLFHVLETQDRFGLNRDGQVQRPTISNESDFQA